MDVQECGIGFELIDMPEDPQGDLMRRQIEFQERIGQWNPRLKDFGKEHFCLPKRLLHHLDMCVQECSEAWDMVEGGWKSHKTNPTEPDPVEVLMELVDVWHFAINAYLFLGGQPEQELVAAACGRSPSQMRYPRVGLDEMWTLGEMSWERHGPRLAGLYGHSGGAHGTDWEKQAATRINYLRSQVMKVAATTRSGLETMGVHPRQARNKFPAASGYLYTQVMPWLAAAFQALPELPGVGPVTQQVVYSAFVHKNDINHARQDKDY